MGTNTAAETRMDGPATDASSTGYDSTEGGDWPCFAELIFLPMNDIGVDNSNCPSHSVAVINFVRNCCPAHWPCVKCDVLQHMATLEIERRLCGGHLELVRTSFAELMCS